MGSLLKVNNLKTYFFTSEGIVRAVDGVNLEINKGETLGLIGESGSGKTVTALSIMRLVPTPPGKIVEGSIIFHGEEILTKSKKEMEIIRGAGIAISFQDPMTFLNPVLKIGDQIAEAIKLHQDVDKKEALDIAVECMKLVQIPSARERVNDYPHQFSGGMRQRILIAIALSCGPDLLIVDEPTTALDIITQGEIIQLLSDLKEKMDLSMLLITHDLGTVCELADKIAVMYAGNIVEYADVFSIFKRPKHPYTKALIESIPKLSTVSGGMERLTAIEGSVPDMINPPHGCRFHPRCPYKILTCSTSTPKLVEIKNGHFVACSYPIYGN